MSRMGRRRGGERNGCVHLKIDQPIPAHAIPCFVDEQPRRGAWHRQRAYGTLRQCGRQVPWRTPR